MKRDDPVTAKERDPPRSISRTASGAGKRKDSATRSQRGREPTCLDSTEEEELDYRRRLDRERQTSDRLDELETEPSSKLVFNAPFVKTQNSVIRLTNRTKGRRRIAWVFKSTNMGRFNVRPTLGQLAPGESVQLEVRCQPIGGDYAAEAKKVR